MAMPIGGIRRPVTITDCTGQEVSITDGKLDVNATVVVPGDVPQAFTFEQDFSVPLDETDALAVIKIPEFMALVLDQAGGGNAGLAFDKVLSVYFVSADGPQFTTALIFEETLAAGTKYKYFSFPPSMVIRAGDHIQVTMSAPGGADTDTVAGTIMFGT